MQLQVEIPIKTGGSSLEKVLMCPKEGCRYVSKTATEQQRHLLHHHGEIAPCPPPDAEYAYWSSVLCFEFAVFDFVGFR